MTNSISLYSGFLLDPFVYDYREYDELLISKKAGCAATMISLLGDGNLAPLFYSQATIDELVDSGAWPNYHIIREALVRSGVRDISVRDISNFISGVIGSDRAIDRELCSGFECSGVDFFEDEKHVIWSDEKKDFLLKAYSPFLLHRVVGSEEQEFGVLGHPVHKGTVRCSVSYSSLDAYGAIKADFAETTMDLVSLDEDVSEEGLQKWKSADTVQKMYDSIRLGLKRFGKDGVAFFIGKDFFQSLVANQCYMEGRYSGALYDKAIRLISGIAVSGDKEMKNGSNEAIVRGECKARRCHITKSNLALRLIYWVCSDGIVLANVGPKNELHAGTEERERLVLMR